MTNMLAQHCQRVAAFLEVVGQPARMQILVALSAQDACVCHLEAALGMRQAAISQHLALLRRAGLVDTRRGGRHVYYRLAERGALQALVQAAEAAGLPPGALAPPPAPLPSCACPMCRPDLDDLLACKPAVLQKEKEKEKESFHV